MIDAVFRLASAAVNQNQACFKYRFYTVKYNDIICQNSFAF